MGQGSDSGWDGVESYGFYHPSSSVHIRGNGVYSIWFGLVLGFRFSLPLLREILHIA